MLRSSTDPEAGASAAICHMRYTGSVIWVWELLGGTREGLNFERGTCNTQAIRLHGIVLSEAFVKRRDHLPPCSSGKLSSVEIERLGGESIMNSLIPGVPEC